MYLLRWQSKVSLFSSRNRNFDFDCCVYRVCSFGQQQDADCYTFASSRREKQKQQTHEQKAQGVDDEGKHEMAESREQDQTHLHTSSRYVDYIYSLYIVYTQSSTVLPLSIFPNTSSSISLVLFHPVCKDVANLNPIIMSNAFFPKTVQLFSTFV